MGTILSKIRNSNIGTVAPATRENDAYTFPSLVKWMKDTDASLKDTLAMAKRCGIRLTNGDVVTLTGVRTDMDQSGMW